MPMELKLKNVNEGMRGPGRLQAVLLWMALTCTALVAHGAAIQEEPVTVTLVRWPYT